MSRFFFNFQQGASYTIDTEGNEFATVEAAYLGAFQAAQDMWRELLIDRQDPLLCSFEVMDDKGNSLFSLPFSEVLDVCRGRVSPEGPTYTHRALHEAQESRRKAHTALADVSATVSKAKQTLSQTLDLLSEVARLAQD